MFLDEICCVLTANANSMPRFAQPIGNVTVAVGRDASLPCAVENLGPFKVSFKCQFVLRYACADSEPKVKQIRSQSQSRTQIVPHIYFIYPCSRTVFCGALTYAAL